MAIVDHSVRLFAARIALTVLACGPTIVPSGMSAPPTPCAGSVSGDTTVYDTAQVEQRPLVRTARPPLYPVALRRQRIQGRVLVDATINADGTVDSQSLTVAHRVQPVLDSESVRWVRAASFWPACRAGQAVRVRVSIPIEYTVYRN